MTNVSSGLRSTFTWERIGSVLCVTDLDDGMLQIVSCSVTNDAENVIRYLYRAAGLLSDERVIYCDTEGRWDELLHQGGKFAGYGMLGCRSRDVAILAVKETPPVPVGLKQEDDPWV